MAVLKKRGGVFSIDFRFAGHSFCSNCAAKGIDQRMINAWVGHQTEEMVRRYWYADYQIIDEIEELRQKLLLVFEGDQ